MRHRQFIIAIFLALPVAAGTLAEEGNFYLGPQLTYYDFDHNRDDLTPDARLADTFHLGLGVGYMFAPNWAAEFSYVTDLHDDSSSDIFSINGFRFWGDEWRPFVSAGVSHFSLDDLREDSTEQVQLGLGVSRMLSNNLEVRLWGQHMYDVGQDSNHDNAITLALNYHFRELKKAVAAVAAVEPAAEMKPQPESMAADEVVVETVELLVEFDTDKHFIRSVYQEQFDRIAQTLKNYPEVSFTVEGHCDWRASEEYNQKLSERRANAIKQKFIEDYGIDPARISTVGYGETRPVASNDTEQGMQRNRRAIAVFKIKKK
ncbi:MAG: OmpA family protein [Gammaproteobacteria bacterium]|nr:OmpA family protein [Gammaproteobacteria bacterium]